MVKLLSTKPMHAKFENANRDTKIDVYKAKIMEPSRDLWNNWRGDLNRQFVKPSRNMQQAIMNCPKWIKNVIGSGLLRNISTTRIS